MIFLKDHYLGPMTGGYQEQGADLRKAFSTRNYTEFPFRIEIYTGWWRLMPKACHYLSKQGIRQGKDFRRIESNWGGNFFEFRLQEHAAIFKLWLPA